MSTRANIIITDSYGDKLIFYRHSDGYPEGTMPTLEKFLDLVKEKKIRDNVEQAAGWLIIIGHAEYNTPENIYPEDLKDLFDWKVGAYEPSIHIHGDIEWLYTIDLSAKTIKQEKV